MLCGLAACTEPAQRAQVRVLVDADSAVRAAVDDVTAVVELQDASGGGWQLQAMRRFEPRVSHPWPFELTLSGADVDSEATYQLTATARDQRGAVVGHARAVRKFAGSRRLELQVLFEASCLRRSQLCPSGETCHDGACVDARTEIDHRKPLLDPPADAGVLAPDGAVLPTPPAVPIESDGEDCSTDGARACTGDQSRIPLRCEAGVWRAEPQCADDELCDTTASAQSGMCRKIARECMGRMPRAEFCDQEQMRVCTNMFESMIRPCVEHARCVAPDQRAECACSMGFVDDNGVCREATDCTVENGGCDRLTSCVMQQGTRKCGTCPPGYLGDGLSGCAALLSGLEVSAGVLSPKFDSSVTEYRVELPLLVQRLSLTPALSGTGHIVLNGEALPASGVWTTPTLPLGEYSVELALTAPNGAARTYTIRVQRSGKQSAYIKASNVGAGDRFGVAIGLDGDTLVISTPYEDSSAKGPNGDQNDDSTQDSGAVYVFVRKSGRWEQQAYLKPTEPTEKDYFGTSVAISGDTLVVGAIRDDIWGLSGSSRPGSAYVFERKQGSWQQTKVLTPSGSSVGDLFGYGVAIAGDTILAGAPFTAGGGVAYAFVRGPEGWREQARIVPQKRVPNSLFGCAVALEGDTAVIGAHNDDTEVRIGGSANVFERSGDNWREQQRLLPNPPSDGASFGYSVAIAGDQILIGAPRVASIISVATTSAGEVFAYQRAGGSWQQTKILKAMVPRASDSFGSALSLDGDAVLIGACGDTSGATGVDADASRRDGVYSGAGYLFAREGQGWRQSAYLKASNTDINDMFGFAAALSGQTAIVSAIWERSNAKGLDGDQNNDSLSMAGAVYVFE